MTTVFFHSDLDDPESWKRTLEAALPDLCFFEGPSCAQPERVDVALVWTPPPQGLNAFPNLKAVLSLGAGVDQLHLEKLSPGIPVARLKDPTLTQRMVEYCLSGVLYFHRHLHLHARHQTAHEWRFIAPVSASDRRVLVLGLGELGSAVSRSLVSHGFKVAGWSRSPKQLPGVECFHGDALPAQALGECDVIINLLPLTARTRGLLDSRFFEQLRTGSCLIQVGRGGHIVEHDLIRALKQGHLAGALVDVFDVEPLPADHPFWSCPGLVLTPHVASLSDPNHSATTVIENIRRAMHGEVLLNTVDRVIGY